MASSALCRRNHSSCSATAAASTTTPGPTNRRRRRRRRRRAAIDGDDLAELPGRDASPPDLPLLLGDNEDYSEVKGVIECEDLGSDMEEDSPRVPTSGSQQSQQANFFSDLSQHNTNFTAQNTDSVERSLNTDTLNDRNDSTDNSPHHTAGTTTNPWSGDSRDWHARLLNNWSDFIDKERKKPSNRQNPVADFLNPDALIRLIGPANEGPVVINGEATTALLDTGAQVSTISADYCQRQNIPIHNIEKVVRIVGTGGHTIPYLGVACVELTVPEFPDFKSTELMLAIHHTPYHDRVPITLGTPALGNILQHQQGSADVMNRPWHFVSTAMKPASNAVLEEITGTAKTTRAFSIPAKTTREIPVYTTFTPKEKHVNIVLQQHSTFQKAGVAVNDSYTELLANHCRTFVSVTNHNSHAIRIPAKTTLADLEPANVIPHFLVPKIVGEDDEEAENKATAQHSAADEDSGYESDEAWVEKNIDLSGTKTWARQLQDKAKKLMVDNVSVFSRAELDLGETDVVEHDITLTDDIPFQERYRRIPPQAYDKVREHLEQMLRMGVIQRSDSDFASAVVIVQKKDGSMRFCIDLRKLNAKTVRDSHPLPRVEESLEALKGSSIFTSLDLRCGYWQVRMSKRARKLTAFTVGPLGFYECIRMPFGLVNAPATFQRLMQTCLGDLHLTCCLIYLDDVIVFSNTPDEHLRRLEQVFDRLKQAGLKLKPSKCFFFQPQLTYLGHIVSKEGIATDPGKTKAAREWPTPVTAKDVQSFLGFVGYYRKFIYQFSQVARPLHQAVQTANAAKARTKPLGPLWTPACEEAFEELKARCCEAPILAYPDFTKPFKLKTDASSLGLGAVLYQEQDGKERVIAYASRALSRAEANYEAHKLEFLALKWAVSDKFYEYLWGSQFTVYTDNNPLTYVMKTAKLDATSHRWVATMASFNFNILYKQGRLNVEADALSRIRWPECLREVDRDELTAEDVTAVCQNVLSRPIPFLETISNSTAPVDQMDEGYAEQPTAEMTEEDWKEEQLADPTLKLIHEAIQNKTWNRLKAKDSTDEQLALYLRHRQHIRQRRGLLFRKTQRHNRTIFQLLLPRNRLKQVLTSCHDEMGHLGADRVLDLLQDRFYWPKMSETVAEHIAVCGRCLRTKSRPEKAPMVPLSASYPLELIHLDFLKLDICKGNIENVLVITDHFTRYAQAYPCNNQTAFTVAKKLWEEFIPHYGFPTTILTDQGKCFEGHLIRGWCKLAGITKIRTTPYHPQTNGQCERFNQTLIRMCRTLEEEQKDDWKTSLRSLVHSYNCTRSAVTGFSPYFLMFGREPRLAIDTAFGTWTPGESRRSYSKYLQRLRTRIKWAYDKAQESADKESERQRKYYDRNIRGSALHKGDLVLVRVMKFKGTGSHKIADRWEPKVYVVVDQPNPDVPVYKVKIAGEPDAVIRTVHRNMLFSIRQVEGDGEMDTDTPDPASPPLTDSVETRRSNNFQGEEEDVDEGVEDVLSEDEVQTDEPVVKKRTSVKKTRKKAVEEPEPDDSAEEEQLPKVRPKRNRKPPERFTDLIWSMLQAHPEEESARTDVCPVFEGL